MFSTCDIDQILPNLYLGSIFAAGNEETLEDNEITHILTMGNYMEPKFPDKFEYKVCKLDDDDTEDIKQYFHEGIEFIDEAIKNGGTVFVHCAAGVSRSSSMICAYLMKTYNWKFAKALSFTQERRWVVCPNSGFQKQLQEFEIEEGI
ncbi:unnamed protein product [Moneuplotes crassus]|uniref:Protein-tyrosine-phosphatase n=1 Tax=Euplotes crassus TaxID=5936 RepID=A0AAD1Y1J1_EUPCR|nr:unnamed protein product [Moneuplotes crassus]